MTVVHTLEKEGRHQHGAKMATRTSIVMAILLV